MEAEVKRLKVSEVYVVSFFQFFSTGLQKTDATHAGKFGRRDKRHA
jgi:hypothetical protein